jgi:hypothetical protein
VPPTSAYQPIRGTERAQWYLLNTGGAAIGGSVLSAGWSTAWDNPREYPATWEGFGKRYALSISGVAIANGAEASLGALWGEDPRFVRKGGNLSDDFRSRVTHVLLSTVTATNRRGQRMPAYSRFLAIPGSNLLQNQWRPESQSSGKEVILRTLYGFLGRMSANAIREFLPDLRRARRVPPNAPEPAKSPAPGTTAP